MLGQRKRKGEKWTNKKHHRVTKGTDREAGVAASLEKLLTIHCMYISHSFSLLFLPFFLISFPQKRQRQVVVWVWGEEGSEKIEGGVKSRGRRRPPPQLGEQSSSYLWTHLYRKKLKRKPPFLIMSHHIETVLSSLRSPLALCRFCYTNMITLDTIPSGSGPGPPQISISVTTYRTCLPILNLIKEPFLISVTCFWM